MAGISSRIVVVVATMLLTLASCGGSPTDDPNNNSQANVTTLDDVLTNEPEPMAPPERLALHEAERRGLVEYEITGNGNSSGASLEIRLRRRAAQPLTVYVAPGTVFGSRSANAQRMVARSLAGTPEIQLVDDQYQDLTLEAYCLDIELDNPSAENSFTAQSIDDRSAAILTEAHSQGLGIGATQAAIWMDQGATGEEIAAVFPATPEDLAAARQLLSRLPPRT